MTNACDLCGAVLTGPVSAVLHYERHGRHPSPCERRRAGMGYSAGLVDLANERRDRRSS